MLKPFISAELESRRFMRAEMAALLAQQVQWLKTLGASPMTYGTGNIATAAMADG
jgi:hypothetical protein